MRRRDFIAAVGAAAVYPIAALAQQPALPVVGYISAAAPDTDARYVAGFRKGLGEFDFVEGQNVSIEYHWLEGQYDRVPALMADLVRRRVAVIAAAGAVAAKLATKATTTIPIVFGVGDDPVRLGLVASLAQPGGNVTGFNFFSQDAVPKRLGLFRELVPKANRVAVLVNPSNIANADATLREAQAAARLIGVPIDILKSSTSREIEEAFATMVGERIEALFIGGDAFFTSRRVQFATLAARHGIASSYIIREFPEVGGLMSYGTDIADMLRQIGAYTGRILKGAKPADLPVVQSVKFEFVINMQTARVLGIEVPPNLLALTTDAIE